MINRELLYKLYKERVYKISDDLDWKTSFTIEEIVSIMSDLIDNHPELIIKDK